MRKEQVDTHFGVSIDEIIVKKEWTRHWPQGSAVIRNRTYAKAA